MRQPAKNVLCQTAKKSKNREVKGAKHSATMVTTMVITHNRVGGGGLTGIELVRKL